MRATTIASGMIVACGLTLAASWVRADAVSAPTVTCPIGAIASAAHFPREGICAVHACTGNADCGTDAYCDTAPLCIVTMSCGGRFDSGPFPDGGFGPPCTFDTAPAACSADGTCTSGTCETRRVCLPRPVAPSAGCGCGVTPAHAGIGAVASILWLALAGARRMSSRRRRAG
jgi:hypothetical protein